MCYQFGQQVVSIGVLSCRLCRKKVNKSSTSCWSPTRCSGRSPLAASGGKFFKKGLSQVSFRWLCKYFVQKSARRWCSRRRQRWQWFNRGSTAVQRFNRAPSEFNRVKPGKTTV